MTTQPTAGVTYHGENSGTAARLPVKTLEQADFLRLLVAQMVSQDPLNPKADLEMIPQMVQFTTLEQSRSMQADIADLRANQQMLQANSLLGRAVELQDGSDTKVTGEVTAVQFEEGTPQLVVNGKRYYLSQVLSIAPLPSS